MSAIFSCDALSQVQRTPQEYAAEARAQCQEAARFLVVKEPGDALKAIERCVQEHSLQRRYDYVDQCRRSASRLATSTVPAEAFFKSCMDANGYRYE